MNPENAAGRSEQTTNLSKRDWVLNCHRSLQRKFPELATYSYHLAEKLSQLMVRRLPSRASLQLLELLPRSNESLSQHVTEAGEASIGYLDFAGSAECILAFLPPSGESEDDVTASRTEKAERIADHFLAALGSEIPEELKRPLDQLLPIELSGRMGIHTPPPRLAA